MPPQRLDVPELTSMTPSLSSRVFISEDRLAANSGAPQDPHLSINIPTHPLAEGLKVRRNDANPELETHYILVIHGTFARVGKQSWFHPDTTGDRTHFCSSISALLSDGPLGAESVWRTLPEAASLPKGVTYPFYWDGTNTDHGRQQAAQNLAKLIKHIGKKDPSARVHIIAHSHGGNVALKAIEQYIQKLESESGVRHWPHAIQEQFKEAHREQAAELKRWRPVEGVSCWQALNPFLVVWRGPQGEKDSAERFPFGYYSFWDWSLRLGRRRQAKFLSRRRMTSPISNALGKIVLLGTPFYYKHWARWIRLKLTASIVVSFLLCYVITFAMCSFWLSLGQQDSFDVGVVAWVSAIVQLFLFTAHMLAWCERTLLRNGNMYHSDKVPWSPAMHALIIKAGKLDEAALALCAEPAARAYLLPLIKRATQSFGWVPLPRRPRRGARFTKWGLYVILCLRATLVNLLDFLPRTVLWGIGKLVVVQTFGILRKVLMGAAFGVDTENLNKASVYADERLVLGGGPRSIHTWDVRKTLAEAEALSCSWSGSLPRASFFSDSKDSPSSCGSKSCGSMSSSSSSERAEGDFRQESALRGGLGALQSFPSARECELYKTDLACTGMGRCSKHPEDNMPSDSLGMLDVFRSLDGAAVSAQSFESSYSFLWDEAKLRQLSDSSVMFKELKKQLRKIDHSPLLSAPEFERELRSICCVFEQRRLEIRGHFQLAHSTYYRNPMILEAIARFLKNLDVPRSDM